MASACYKGVAGAALILFLCSAAVQGSSKPYNVLDHFPKSAPDHDLGTSSGIRGIEDKIKIIMTKGKDLFITKGSTVIVKLKLSAHCEASVLKLVRGILHIEDWAVRMADAMGKPSPGILEGTAAALGDYDECLDIVAPENFRLSYSDDEMEEPLRGQYCMLKLRLPEVLKKAAMDYQAGNRTESYLTKTDTIMKNLIMIAPRADIAESRLGLCIPSKCSKDDLATIINTVFGTEDTGVSVLRCEQKEDQSKLKLDQLIILAILGGMLFLALMGTGIDCIFRCTGNEPVDDVFMRKQNAYVQFIMSFSLYTNFKKLTSLRADDGSLSCVRGIKFLSVCLSVVVSTYAMPSDFHFHKYRNAFNFFKFLDVCWFSLIANASVGVDTLFFVAGLQITYRIWKKGAGNYKGIVSINIPKFLVVWYGRLTASQLMVIGLFLLFPLIGCGPLWEDLVTTEVDRCRNTWWMNILYINNFWPSNETCLYHTWFVSSLMHMLVVMPFLLWILNRYTAFGVLLILVLIVGSTVAIAVVTILRDLPPAPAIYFLSFLNMKSIWDQLFIQAYDHVGPFCIGILLGYILAQKPKFGLRKVTVVLGWLAVAVTNIVILVGLRSYRHVPMTMPLAAAYASLHRTAWSLGIGWVVFACTYGYGGVINSLLSCKMFIPLDRLSNFIYLLHPLIILFHSGQIRERMYMGNLDQVMYATAYIFYTCVLSALCYVMLYYPFTALQSLLGRQREEMGFSNHTSSSIKGESIVNCVTSAIRMSSENVDRDIIPETTEGDGVVNEAFHL